MLLFSDLFSYALLAKNGGVILRLFFNSRNVVLVIGKRVQKEMLRREYEFLLSEGRNLVAQMCGWDSFSHFDHEGWLAGLSLEREEIDEAEHARRMDYFIETIVLWEVAEDDAKDVAEKFGPHLLYGHSEEWLSKARIVARENAPEDLI